MFFLHCRWINGEYSLGQKYRGIGEVQQTLHSWCQEKSASPISKIDDFVKHVYREHNQEADHWANIGAQGQRKIVSDRCDNSETAKTVNGYWGGSFKDNGKSGCGVVIKGDDRNRWVTISRITVSFESWHGGGSRSCRCMRAHGDP